MKLIVIVTTVAATGNITNQIVLTVMMSAAHSTMIVSASNLET